MMVSKSKSSLTPQLWGLFYFEASLLSKTYNSLFLGSSESYFFSAPKGSKTLCMEVHRITTYSDKMYCLHAWQMIHFLVISDNINGTWRTSQNSTLHITAWSMRRFMPIWHYLCQRRSIKRAVPYVASSAQNSLYAYILPRDYFHASLPPSIWMILRLSFLLQPLAISLIWSKNHMLMTQNTMVWLLWREKVGTLFLYHLYISRWSLFLIDHFSILSFQSLNNWDITLDIFLHICRLKAKKW